MVSKQCASVACILVGVSVWPQSSLIFHDISYWFETERVGIFLADAIAKGEGVTIADSLNVAFCFRALFGSSNGAKRVLQLRASVLCTNCLCRERRRV